MVGKIYIASMNMRGKWADPILEDSLKINAPPSLRILGYQCTNPHCGKVFTILFAYD